MIRLWSPFQADRGLPSAGWRPRESQCCSSSPDWEPGAPRNEGRRDRCPSASREHVCLLLLFILFTRSVSTCTGEGGFSVQSRDSSADLFWSHPQKHTQNRCFTSYPASLDPVKLARKTNRRSVLLILFFIGVMSSKNTDASIYPKCKPWWVGHYLFITNSEECCSLEYCLSFCLTSFADQSGGHEKGHVW